MMKIVDPFSITKLLAPPLHFRYCILSVSVSNTHALSPPSLSLSHPPSFHLSLSVHYSKLRLVHNMCETIKLTRDKNLTRLTRSQFEF